MDGLIVVDAQNDFCAGSDPDDDEPAIAEPRAARVEVVE